MSEPRLKITHRNLPHWTIEGGVYFVTFRVAKNILVDAERYIVLDHLNGGHGQFYHLLAAVVMPDHVHFLFKPTPPYELSRIMKGIKGVSSRKINERRCTSGRIWQEESWDRIVRDAEELQEKLVYMANNPVKAGLVGSPEEYPYWSCNPQLIV